MSQRKIQTDPPEVNFEEVELNTKYTKTVLLTNTTTSPLEIALKPCPTLDRDYEIFPSTLTLRAKESSTIKISLITSKLGTLRDVVHISAESFSEKLYINIQGSEPTKKHFQSIFQDKETQLQTSQSRIDRLEEEIEEISEKLRLANIVINEKARVEQELAKVQQENSEIRAAMQELQRSEVYSQKFKEMIKEKVPSLENLIELTLKQEKEKNERKNEKILEILQIKDSLIEDLEEKNAELQNAITIMQHKLNDNKVLLSNTEKTLHSTQKTIEDLKTASFEKDQMIQSLKNKGNIVSNIPQEDSVILKNELIKNFDHIKQLSETIQKYEVEITKLKNREEYVLELSNRNTKFREDHEKIVKNKDLMINELKAKVSTQSEHIDSLILKLSSMNYNEIVLKVSKLEEENKNLSKLLADSHRSSETFKKEDLDDLESQKLLELENEKLSISLKNITDRTTQLEGLLSSKNKEIISLQNELIDFKKLKNEAALKAAPSPHEDIARLSNSLQEEQLKALKLEDENQKLKNMIKSLENSHKQINFEISSLFDHIESPNPIFSNTQNQLLAKISEKIQNLKIKEQQAIKAANSAEQEIKSLQFELFQENTTEAAKSLKNSQNEVQILKTKNELLLASNIKLNQELEEKKQIITAVSFAVSQEKQTIKKGKRKLRTPHKLIKALITAKIGEAEASKKLVQAGKYELELRESLARKEDQCKSLEKELKNLNKNKTVSESFQESLVASEVANRKIFDLELELQELKENEMHSWAQYRPLSLLFKPEPSSATEDYEILIEGFLYLIDQYSYRDSEIKSENIEKAQRIIIKTLFSRQKLLESDEKVEKITFFPSREEDRKIWYVEVLESQLENVKNTIKSFTELMHKQSPEVPNNVNSAASFKAASLDLAKSIKEISEKIEILKNICIVIRFDCENIAGAEYLNKKNIFDKKLEEELQKALLAKNKEIKDFSSEKENLKNELVLMKEKLNSFVAESKNIQFSIGQYKNKIEKQEAEKKELQRAIEALCEEVKESDVLKEQALARVDKVYNEMKD